MNPLSLLDVLLETTGSTLGVEADPGLETARIGLLAARLLQRAGNATTASCDSCGVDHVEDIQYRGSRGATEAFIVCPRDGAVRVAPDRLPAWRVDLQAVARALARAVSAPGDPRELVEERSWLLRRDSGLEVFFVRGLTWPDATRAWSETMRHFEAAHPVVLTTRTPPAFVSSHQAIRSSGLRESLEWSAAGLRVRSPLSGWLSRRAAKATTPVDAVQFPPGTTWGELRMVLRDDGVVVLGRGLRHSIPRSALGTGREQRLWGLLRLLAADDHQTGAGETGSKPPLLRKTVERLNTRLRAVCGIAGNAIVRSPEGRYTPSFACSQTECEPIRLPANATWESLTIQEMRDGSIGVFARGTQRTVGVDGASRDQGRRTGHLLVPAEEEAPFEERLSLHRMMMVDREGSLTPLGSLFLEALRHGGAISRDEDDDLILELCAYLKGLFQQEDWPFEPDERNRRWLARFKVGS